MSDNFIGLIGGDKLILPLKWSVTTLSDHMGLFRSGTSISPADFSSEGVEVIPKRAISDSTRYKVSDDDQQYVSEEFIKKNKNAVIEKEFLVTALRDLVPSGPNIGRVVRIEDDKKRLMAQGTYAFKLKPSLIPIFYAYISNVDYFRAQMRAIMVGSTQVHIRAGEYLSTPFIIPEIQVQQKIAKILTITDNLIEQTQALIDKYTAIKQGMMADLFTRGIDLCGSPETNPNHGQLRPSFEEAPELYKETELGWIPYDWSVSNLSSLLEGERCPSGIYKEKIDYGDGHNILKISEVFRYDKYRGEEIQRVPLSNNEYKANRIEVGDILIAIASVKLEGVGKVMLIESLKEDTAYDHNVSLIRSNKLNFSGFIYRYMAGDQIRSQIRKKCTQVGTIFLKSSSIMSFNFPVIDIDEQKKIVQKLVSIENSIENEFSVLMKYKETKKGLMQDLLTGKVRVNA